jgi:hypothetical protein
MYIINNITSLRFLYQKHTSQKTMSVCCLNFNYYNRKDHLNSPYNLGQLKKCNFCGTTGQSLAKQVFHPWRPNAEAFGTRLRASWLKTCHRHILLTPLTFLKVRALD